MKKIDWLYFRSNCETCKKTQQFIAVHKLQVASQISTKEKVYPESEARKLLVGIDRLISGKGKHVVSVDLRKAKLEWSELAKVMIGPYGNLRAPVIRIGKTLIVGYHEETYREQLL